MFMSQACSMEVERITPEVVLSRIQIFILTWLEELVDPDGEGLPVIEVVRRTGGDRPTEADEELALQNESTAKKDLLSRTTARSYTAIFLVLQFCHKLLQAGRTATLREVYYSFKGSDCAFKNQAEADEAVLNAASLLGVARHELGIFASAKGYVAGPVRFRLNREDAWTDCSEGSLIKSIWITDGLNIEVQSTARYLMVIEKEGIYQRLLEDGVTKQLGGVILVTGKGFPDVATRACVHALSKAMPYLQIYGLSDCNPFGAAIMLSYKNGSWRMGQDVGAFAVPRLQWVGLRPSQVFKLPLPPDVMQSFAKTDTSRTNGLLRTAFIRGNEQWQEEMVHMQESKVKCELEALNALGIDYLSSHFLIESVLRRDVI